MHDSARLPVLPILMCVALAGCAADVPTQSAQDGAVEVPPPQLPSSIHHKGSMVGIGVAGATWPTTACLVPNQGCVDYPFDVPQRLHVTASLKSINGPFTDATSAYWESDYDLELYDANGRQLSSSYAGNPDVASVTLAPGTYRAHVFAWHDIDGYYELDIAFEPAPSQT